MAHWTALEESIEDPTAANIRRRTVASSRKKENRAAARQRSTTLLSALEDGLLTPDDVFTTNPWIYDVLDQPLPFRAMANLQLQPVFGNRFPATRDITIYPFRELTHFLRARIDAVLAFLKAQISHSLSILKRQRASDSKMELYRQQHGDRPTQRFRQSREQSAYIEVDLLPRQLRSQDSFKDIRDQLQQIGVAHATTPARSRRDLELLVSSLINSSNQNLVSRLDELPLLLTPSVIDSLPGSQRLLAQAESEYLQSVQHLAPVVQPPAAAAAAAAAARESPVLVHDSDSDADVFQAAASDVPDNRRERSPSISVSELYDYRPSPGVEDEMRRIFDAYGGRRPVGYWDSLDLNLVPRNRPVKTAVEVFNMNIALQAAVLSDSALNFIPEFSTTLYYVMQSCRRLLMAASSGSSEQSFIILLEPENWVRFSEDAISESYPQFLAAMCIVVLKHLLPFIFPRLYDSTYAEFDRGVQDCIETVVRSNEHIVTSDTEARLVLTSSPAGVDLLRHYFATLTGGAVYPIQFMLLRLSAFIDKHWDERSNMLYYAEHAFPRRDADLGVVPRESAVEDVPFVPPSPSTRRPSARRFGYNDHRFGDFVAFEHHSTPRRSANGI